VSGVVALVLALATWPMLAARAMGGRPPSPGPKLAALAPIAALLAVVAVAVAATWHSWLAVLLALPAAILVAWQLPPPRPPSHRAGGPGATGHRADPDSGPGVLTLRVLNLNVLVGRADPAGLLGELQSHRVDVLAVQELTPEMVGQLAGAGLAGVLPFSHLDPHPGFPGMGLWARWPLIPLPPIAGMKAPAPRARIEPSAGQPVTVSSVHPVAPTNGNDDRWQRDLGLVGSVLDGAGEPQVVAGDFNATRDHRPFRDLLAAGFLDCADAALSRAWPGFTWPANRMYPPVMRLDHVLVSAPGRTAGWAGGVTVLEARVIRVPGTDHCGVLAVIEFQPVA
jgi:endonuclease/exonuclease/phosphatase (EEP) superfamily protein YafD